MSEKVFVSPGVYTSEKDITSEEARKAKNRVRIQEWRQKNCQKVKESKIKSYVNNKDKNLKYAKEYRIKNKRMLNNKNKEYSTLNKDKRNKRDLDRKINEPLFKLKENLKSLIRNSIKNNGFKKLSKTTNILGCNYEEFKKYLEDKFEPWMSWDNYGNPKDGFYELNKTWDMDHIIAISSAKDELELINLNHYTNFQPLCSYINRWVKTNKTIK
jgi:hypothetical protein